VSGRWNEGGEYLVDLIDGGARRSARATDGEPAGAGIARQSGLGDGRKHSGMALTRVGEVTP